MKEKKIKAKFASCVGEFPFFFPFFHVIFSFFLQKESIEKKRKIRDV